jgi:anti-sigma factor RsiW
VIGKGSMHEELRDDLAAYALGALDRGEAVRLEQHLSGCHACADYLTWLAPAVELLPASVEQEEPPERLRENLMATVRAEAAAEREAERRAHDAGTGAARRWWSWGGPILRPATLVAAVTVLVVGAIVGYGLGGSDDPQRDFVEAEAVGPVPAAALAATLEHGAGGDAILHVERAPALPKGDVYQAWASKDGSMAPLESFRPADDGTAEAALGHSLEGVDEVLITEEPTPNEDQPTSAPILRADPG